MEQVPPSLVVEVRSFLTELRSSWPALFAPNPRPKAANPSPLPFISPSEAVPSRILIPSVPLDAPFKAALPACELVPFFRSRAEFYAPFLGVTFGRVSVKDQRTLWGSCTREGNLNFNWRLTMAPPEVLDYLVVHELAHRAEMNHSRRFWGVVERVCPAHRAQRRWLRKHGKTLQAAKRRD